MIATSRNRQSWFEVLVLLVSAALSTLPAYSAQPWADSPKRGLGISLKQEIQAENLKRLHLISPAWHYHWGARLQLEGKSLVPGIQFVPMAWGRAGPRNHPTTWTMGAQAGLYDTLLGFNEPDMESQSDMAVQEALDLWPLLEKTGLRLGSPAVAQPQSQWLQAFMQGVKQRGLRVDFVAVHSYGGADAKKFLAKLDALHRKYGLPIWITEFGVGDWTAESVEANRYSDKEVYHFMASVLPLLEQLEYVERYAWFSASRKSSALTHSALFEEDGSLTALGRLYRGRQDQVAAEVVLSRAPRTEPPR